MSLARFANAVLARAPHWMLDIAEWLVARDGAVLQRVKARAARGVPLPEAIGPRMSAKVRLLIGPFNYAGQAFQWARSLNAAAPDVDAQNLAVVFPNDLGFESSARVPAVVFAGSSEWKSLQMAQYSNYSHVIIESCTSTLGWGRGRGVEREIAWHRNNGRSVALLCHGTDVRSPARHIERNPYSPFSLSDRNDARIEKRAAQNRSVLERFEGHVFYSTPDLIHDVPQGSWLPLVVQPETWEEAGYKSQVKPEDRVVPVVMHAPTSTKMKGTEAVESAVASLGDVVEYLPLRGVLSKDMPARVAAVDIVVDQLLLGSYGVAACEAMAAGRVVVGNVDEEVRAAVRGRFGLEVPIVQATPDTLESVLLRLANSPGERALVARQGPQFVRSVHSGERSYEVLNAFLAS